MWPFPKRTPDTPRVEPVTLAALHHRMAEFELEQIEARDQLEKVLAAVKRLQGKLLRRVQLAEEASGSPVTDDETPTPVLTKGDHKAQLRHRANALRRGVSDVNGG